MQEGRKIIGGLALFLLLAVSARAQTGMPLLGVGSMAGAAAIPGFVGETSKNSTLTNALGTNPTGQTDCSAYSYCIPLPEAGLSANGVVLSYTYSNGSSSVPTTATATDDKSDSYICVNGSERTDGGTDYWNGFCYAPNITAGAHRATLTFGTTGVENVSAKFAQFYNLATSLVLDASTTCAGTASTTANCGSVTTNYSNDLIYVHVCPTGAVQTGNATPGSGFTMGTEGPKSTSTPETCYTEFEVDSGTGSTTPTMTLATSSTYLESVQAYKAASAGTAPTGWYMAHLMSWSTPASATGTYTFQSTSQGNFLVMTYTGGSTIYPTGITDGTNTWTKLGSVNISGIVYTGPDFYVSGATANTGGGISVATTGTGDGTFTFEDYVSAPSSPIVTRQVYGGAQTAAATLTWICDHSNDSSCPATGFSYSSPYPTSGLVIAVGGLDFNTYTGVNAPSGFLNDQASTGGEAISGPYPVDQNNIFAHGYTAAGGLAAFVTNLSYATLAPSAWTGDLIGVWGGTASTGILNFTAAQATSTPLTITVPSTTSGNLIAVAIQVYDSTARTISSVCFDGTTCAAGNALTQLAGATSTGTSGHGATSIWYILSAPSGKTTLTVTASGASSNLEAIYSEVQKNSGTWATDGGTATSGGTGSGTTVQAPSITTTGSVDYCTSAFAVAGSGMSTFPKNGNEYTYGGTIWSNDKNAGVSLLTTAATGHQPQLTDGTSGDTYSSSHGCFK